MTKKNIRVTGLGSMHYGMFEMRFYVFFLKETDEILLRDYLV
ncbi:hypothetical protein Echvi_4571 [Echinicola vietnamensis DSM 17526]|uniref:Uncharacterized protein n=1 Tax=Echinicola vietnamensis (strain DSM 17526 / LMG 23754 / KMM 6221) TaxID=926556 RepID=L0G3C9_ECHVK|nr:hypothetical protein Echvi_4571 [Echinicola vietnamensis DSM 17526]